MKSICFIGIHKDALQRIPNDVLLEELSHQVGDIAVELGVALGLSMVDIEESLFRYPKSMFDQTCDVLKKWNNSRKEVMPTICILMRAMQESDSRGFWFLKRNLPNSLNLYTSSINTVG
jgi:hypothetical protein